MQKFQQTYKQSEVAQKVTLPTTKSVAAENVENVRDLNSHDIREFLSADEKRTLREVFGDLALDKNTHSKYNGTQNIDFLKGSQIDIRL
jgi:hypothetical protein